MSLCSVSCPLADLIAIDHQMVCSGERLEDNHPAGAGSPLKQGISQLRDVHIHLVGALNQVCRSEKCKVGKDELKSY